MEEGNAAAPHSRNPNPTETIQSAGAGASTAAVAAEAVQVANKKRKLESGEFRNSKYFKIRLVVKELRPLFLEVIRSPEFRDCKAAHEIGKQMKILMDLSKELKIETAFMEKPINPPEQQPLPGEFMEILSDKQTKEEIITEKDSQSGCIPSVSGILQDKLNKISSTLDEGPEKEPDKVITEAKNLEKQLQGLQGTYIVGGSPMGWNFLVYPGGSPVFYGVTKETARLRRDCR